MSQTSTNVTQLLREWNSGSSEALEKLIPIIYEELRARAAGYLRRERPGHTLQPPPSSTRPTSGWPTRATCLGRAAHTSSPSPRR